ncbi:MAG: hypothetical protein A2498_00245 [Lentisphaerae bacterium RIFOXYC12_FULL_60_16]|nr:MAG: hypothetical protein A2498_00245 [Lentisphaerae bacterium RIFOXYC12_FULL_60_16]OGV72337.1 MAG: hypothetical protein A2269_05475 [Lentisphaerae bacterium RIFOXYA12_FULL_60_10]OGV84233.1 MAG: hypothetical protein A2340_02770 [Lentisphaerae bacterium RIFOXYB12_FULL_60_10]
MAFPSDYALQLFDRSPRRLRWTPERHAQIESWSAEVRQRLADLLKLDITPPPVPPVRILEQETLPDGIVREKLVLDLPLPGGEVPAYLLRPARPIKPAAGILCLHGHGGYFAGKDMVAGITKNTHPIAVECAEALNYGYGIQLAREGFVTLCPDAFNFGERMPESQRWPETDICGRWNTLLTIFGYHSMGLTLTGNFAAISYLLSRPEVTLPTAGCVGLSFGGVQTMLTSILDHRIGASVISGALFSLRGESLEENLPSCAAQSIPGMLDWFDFPDLAASLVPRPALYELMKRDGCFKFEQSHPLYETLAGIYAKRNASDRIALDVADTDHRYIGRLVPDFFRQHLTASNKGKPA